MSEGFVTTLREVQAQEPGKTRRWARHLALDALSLRVEKGEKWTRALAKNRVQFLYVHHSFRDEEGPLRRLLDALQREHTFISHSEAVRRVLTNQIDRPYVAFSSDDGFKNNLVAARVFEEYGISACFFVCPGMVGETSLKRIAAFNEEVLAFPPVEYLDWPDLETMIAQGHELGGHTVNHVNLGQVSEAVAHREIEASYRTLSEQLGSVAHFAWPYGHFGDLTGHARQAVFDVGYVSCAAAVRGCHIELERAPADPSAVCIRRDHVVLGWPARHVLYLMARNSLAASEETTFFPEELCA